MAGLVFGGAESGGGGSAAAISAAESLGTFSILGTAPSNISSGQRSGDRCYRAAPNVQSIMRINPGRADGIGYYDGVAFKCGTSFPSLTVSVLQIGGGGLLDVRIDSSGNLVVNFLGVVQTIIPFAAVLDTWFYVETYSMISAAGNDAFEVWVNEVSRWSRSGNNDTATLFSNHDIGPAAAYGTSRTIDWDDIYTVDTNGAAPLNARLGPIKIPSSRPVADISRVGWTDYDNSTGNLYDSLDNHPPVPIAPTTGVQTANAGVKNAASSATDNLVVELQSANEEGIDADDIILATQLICTHGLDSATSTTVTSQQILGNDGHPATVESNFDANAASGTWPTGWIVGRILTPSPTIVNRATRPQVEIGKRTAATRISAVGQARIDWVYLPVTGGAGLTQDINDTLALADDLSFGQGKVIAETLTLSDAYIFDQSKVLADILALADSFSLGQEKVISDILALVDAQLIETGKGLSLADTLILTDAQLIETGKGLTLSDTLPLSDTLIFSQTKLITDVLALADAQSLGLGKVLADTLPLADSSFINVGLFRTLTDTLVLSDSFLQETGKGLTLADTLSLADTVIFSQTKLITDVLALADAQSLGLGKGLIDTLALVDSFSTNVNFFRTLTDTLTLSDSSLQDTGKGITLADTLILTDSLALTRPLALADTLALADAISFERSVYLSLADTLLLSDTYIFAHGRTLADILPLADIYTFTHGRTLADTLALVDVVSPTLGKQLTLADTLALADIVSSTLGKQLTLSDTLVLFDQLTFAYKLVLADALVLADIAGLSLGRELTLADVLSLVDSILVVNRLAGVVLNEATALYLGEQVILASYLGDKLIWPEGE